MTEMTGPRTATALAKVSVAAAAATRPRRQTERRLLGGLVALALHVLALPTASAQEPAAPTAATTTAATTTTAANSQPASASEDKPVTQRELAAQNERLTKELAKLREELTALREDHSLMREQVNGLLPLATRFTGYLDFGFFYVGGDGTGIRTDIGYAHFPEFQPPQNRFFPPVAGVAPGEVVVINASLQGMPVQTGVLVMYADDVSFTLMTPQGHPESGWVTFSAWDEVGGAVCQVQSMARANDPVFEIGFALGGAAAQEAIWRHVLTQLAAFHGVTGQVVYLEKQCVDRRLQWGQASNIWQNAAIRSMVHLLTRPFRRA